MQLHHELIDDIPLIIEFCNRLNLAEIIDTNFKTHGNQEGLSNGELALGWIAHILSQGDHRKSPVEEWAHKHKMTLQAFLKKEISDVEFEDCRLSRLLDKFADDQDWQNFEGNFYRNSFAVLQLDTNAPNEFKEHSNIEDDGISKTVKIDSTTAYGHHETIEGGIMQRGWSKDHRPDLPQLKIMASVEGNTGVSIASDILPGNRPDDPLYVPIIERTRTVIDTKNCLYCGDAKMSVLSTRANIVAHNEFYLVPIQLHATEKREFDEHVNKIVNGTQEGQLIYEKAANANGPNKIIGGGYEFTRIRSYDGISWEERVLVVRSTDHAEREIAKTEKSVSEITKKLQNLSSSLYKNAEEAENELRNKTEKILAGSELIHYEIEIEAEEKLCKRAEERNGKTRQGSYKLKKYRAKIKKVTIDNDKFEEMRHKAGWRPYVTNAPKKILTFASAYRFYRKTMYVIEIGFHYLKDYINISPLFVRNERQIIGLTRLLMLALKILTLMSAEIRCTMEKEKAVLQGLYAGQPSRKHTAPTAQSILEYFSRQNIALIGVKTGESWHWQIKPLNDMCRRILELLKIPQECYSDITSMLNLI
jgi:transposase